MKARRVKLAEAMIRWCHSDQMHARGAGRAWTEWWWNEEWIDFSAGSMPGIVESVALSEDSVGNPHGRIP